MAAIIEPRRLPTLAPQRPALRLVPAHGGRPVDAPVDLGIGAGHVVAAIVALLVALMLALAIGNGALASLAPAPSSSTGPAAATAGSGATATMAVQAGDTLWTIARRIQPTGDVRPLVDQLVQLNGTEALQVGDQVLVPR